jgi:hypothetical protein
MPMLSRFRRLPLVVVLFAVSPAPPSWAATVDVAPLVRAIKAVGPKGAGHRAAIAAWSQLAAADAAQLPEVLAGMDGAGPLAANWLRSAVETIVHRAADRGVPLPVAALEKFLAERTGAPKARRIAYELILSRQPEAKQRLVAGLLDDPSLELRRDALTFALADARRLLETGQKPQAAAAYRRTLSAARDLDQIKEATAQLRGLGETVDLPKHFGFIVCWKLVGPFDNRKDCGYDVEYAPEQNPQPDAEYTGKEGPVRWIDHTTADEYGMVDLNKALAKHKGAIAYAYAEFRSAAERDAEFRLGCVTAHKIWLNGALLTANHVYHTGSYIDQYVAKGRLRPGKNVILLKIAQNEQTDSWAQDWKFQFRVCDRYGTAILSADRER